MKSQALKVREIIAKHMGIKVLEVTDGVLLGSDLMVDSLDIVEIIIELEEEFGIKIPDDDGIDTNMRVDNVIHYLRGKTS